MVCAEVIDDLIEPSPRVSIPSELRHSEDKGLLHDVLGVLLDQPMPVRCPPDERQEKVAVESFELG